MSAHAHHESPTAHPVTLIRAAVVWCRASGIPVRLSSKGRGVHCVSQQAPKWARDSRFSAVDPVGAAVLNYQPESIDPVEAAAECLFAPRWWIEAFEAGLNREDFAPTWAKASDRVHRAKAYEAGLRYRADFIRVPSEVVS